MRSSTNGSGPSRATAGPGEAFSRSPSEEILKIFLSKVAHSGVGLLYILKRRRPKMSRGPGELTPCSYSSLSTGLNRFSYDWEWCVHTLAARRSLRWLSARPAGGSVRSRRSPCSRAAPGEVRRIRCRYRTHCIIIIIIIIIKELINVGVQIGKKISWELDFFSAVGIDQNCTANRMYVADP